MSDINDFFFDIDTTSVSSDFSHMTSAFTPLPSLWFPQNLDLVDNTQPSFTHVHTLAPAPPGTIYPDVNLKTLVDTAPLAYKVLMFAKAALLVLYAESRACGFFPASPEDMARLKVDCREVLNTAWVHFDTYAKANNLPRLDISELTYYNLFPGHEQWDTLQVLVQATPAWSTLSVPLNINDKLSCLFNYQLEGELKSFRTRGKAKTTAMFETKPAGVITGQSLTATDRSKGYGILQKTVFELGAAARYPETPADMKMIFDDWQLESRFLHSGQRTVMIFAIYLVDVCATE